MPVPELVIGVRAEHVIKEAIESGSVVEEMVKGPSLRHLAYGQGIFFTPRQKLAHCSGFCLPEAQPRRTRDRRVPVQCFARALRVPLIRTARNRETTPPPRDRSMLHLEYREARTSGPALQFIVCPSTSHASPWRPTIFRFIDPAVVAHARTQK